MLNICLCGSEAGYPHDKDCPSPYYGDNPQSIAFWKKAQKREKEKRIFLEKIRPAILDAVFQHPGLYEDITNL